MGVPNVGETSASSGGGTTQQTSSVPATSEATSKAAERVGASGATSSSSSVTATQQNESDGFQRSDEDDDDDFSTSSFGGGDFDEATPDEQGAEGPKHSDPVSTADKTKPTDFAERLKALDKDGDGKVTRDETGLDEKAFGKLDADGNGKVSKDEYRADFHRQNSFQALDRDGDGKLSTSEIEKLERFGQGEYDKDGDGQVSADEFVAGRRSEMRDAREARIADRLDGLEGDDLKKKLEKFDADGDGKLTVDEVMNGRREARDQNRAERSDKLFETLAAGDDGFSLEGHKEYKAYDLDGDGTVSRKEFREGQSADWSDIHENRYIDGGASPEARKRLGVDAAGQAKPTVSATSVNVGDLKGLTYDKVCDIIKSQGGQLFENGQPTILALRTDNAGTSTYDDVFVVVKPNGEMQTFAGTTRPGFTTPSGGWNPDMAVAGNYQLTPRPADGKWSNAFYIENQNGDMALRAAVDRDGDGRYSSSELANPTLDDEIRMHPGNATTTSSAGCFNVQDYDAFLAFLGGHDRSYNMTLVNV